MTNLSYSKTFSINNPFICKLISQIYLRLNIINSVRIYTSRRKTAIIASRGHGTGKIIIRNTKLFFQ